MQLITKWRIRVLKARIDAMREYSAALENQFQAASNDAQKTRIARRFDKALKRTHSMQLQLELLEANAEKSRNGLADI